IRGKLKSSAGETNVAFHTTAPEQYPDMYKMLTEKNVSVNVKNNQPGAWSGVLFYVIVPLLLIGGMWFFMIRQMQTGGNKALSFGKSRARLLSMQQKKVTFKDVAGVEEAKEELREIIEFLREAQKFQKLGGRIPKGVLLVGPPGTGKTLLARAVAGEANVPFFSISGSDFVEMFVGVGASRVRDLFDQGKKTAPCIIFIDEIDAVGRHRGAGLGGGHDEREQTLNQLLVEMDGFESNDGVILIASTNRPDVLDPALLRPGRFDRRVVVSRPDVRGREGILKVHTRKIPLGEDVDISIIALGVTQQLPEGDRHNYTQEYLLGQISILMGGRVAEETFLGNITTGASNDIEKATELARAMVCEYGMSELGPLTFGKKEEQIFLGREIAQHRDYSEETSIRIDSEVRKIVTEQYERARRIIEENRDTMVRLAENLLEHESLDGVQIRRIVAGLPLVEDTEEPSTVGSEEQPKIKEPA